MTRKAQDLIGKGKEFRPLSIKKWKTHEMMWFPDRKGDSIFQVDVDCEVEYYFDETEQRCLLCHHSVSGEMVSKMIPVT